ncbi:MAG: cysteine--tRNA ligase [Patescibacteria group bacterium]|nr:cysteine--tRNA ligase [Patescibacteria group bacterium]
MLKIYNTLSRKKETFKPIKKNQVGMYTCGPTVYGPGHLGHARSYVNFDILKRMFLYNGYKVKHILNITDVHDDMIKKANELDITIRKLANRYTPLFLKDLADLNIIPANKYPKVTEHVPGIIRMTQALINKDYGYVEKDGSVYYDVSKFKNYGKLSGIKLDKAKTGTRVETDKYEKKDIADFALWKGWKKGEPYWKSPWGKGRPGWHIECSVMASKYLGKTIDLHGGAMDLKFPHHENEIAQSEAANEVRFVNYWFHAGLLDIEGQKMSKSLGNYIEMHEVKSKGFNPLSLRYLFLTAHYRSKMNFTWKSLKSAEQSLNNLYQKVIEIKTGNKKQTARNEIMQSYQKKFLRSINDDLDMPKALALMWNVVKSKKLSNEEKYKIILDFDKVFGLNLAKIKKPSIPKKIKDLVKIREEYRKKDDWKKADRARKEIKELGYSIKDTKEGSKINKI